MGVEGGGGPSLLWGSAESSPIRVWGRTPAKLHKHSVFDVEKMFPEAN